MTALHARLALYANDQTAMANLAASCGIGSSTVASDAYLVTLRTVLDGYSARIEKDSDATRLHTLSLQLTQAERDRPSDLFSSPGHALSRVLVGQLFSSALPAVRADVAAAAGLGTADRLVELTALACLASAAGPAPSPAGRSEFVATVGAGHSDFVSSAGSPAPFPPPPPSNAGLALRPPAGLPLAGATSNGIESPVAEAGAERASLAAPRPATRVAAATLAAPGAASLAVASQRVGVVAGREDSVDKSSRWPWLPWVVVAAWFALLVVGVIVVSGDDDQQEIVSAVDVSTRLSAAAASAP